ncbi:hypothetical protein G4177_21550 [Corallococcus sp. ZKHCc1 1396]|uniref:Lipoprotein n=1 Tax=Corallococcus soli TaxID=2710757 RepID=A0ABR9PS84_9BACT|nr:MULTISPECIES: hypothetical protein [Corallococcus]MBE4750760.1 hypothetical protein [Corallococcus soli]MCY1031869.1 hypothetical protein [Corallococcus sp. BB11-1]
MHSRTLCRWTMLGTFAAAVALIGPGCNRDRPLMPQGGSRYEGIANTQQRGTPMTPMEPGTGGAGNAGTTAAEDGAGAQGHTNKIGAPGYTAPNENTQDPGGTQQFIQGHEQRRSRGHPTEE